MKLFTINEANALIPKIRVIYTQIQNVRRGLSIVDPYVKPARENAAWGGGSLHGGLFVLLIQRFSGIMREIESMGVLVKDLEAGLFDFPYRLEDRVVLLCWRNGETEIDWYHDLDTGFSGRKRLPKDPDRIT